MKKIALASFAVSLALFGCQQRPAAPRETGTAGRIMVVGSDGAFKLMNREAQAFNAIYQQAAVAVAGGGSKAGIIALNDGSARIAVLAREITPAEDSIIRLNGGKVDGYRIALDGLTVIVNRQNGARRLTFAQLERIFSGAVSDWSAVGGSGGAIHIALPAENLGAYEYFRKVVLKGGRYSGKVHPCTTNVQIVEAVRQHPNAIGLVAYPALYRSWDEWPPAPQSGIKAVAVGLSEASGFALPNQKTVNDGSYPLVRPVYLYVNDAVESQKEAAGGSLAHGFITFVSSAEGQRLVAKQGFVPATMPVVIKQ
ncbi:MAG TPA: PstS family phosphate ABC transporter substrate-binding protein [Candidatus Edwardsbacteria bacterium]|nr:PstS family phosphate ABC transporter substrate-binding protein [Candidatus Edwardsbacteria bacterium]